MSIEGEIVADTAADGVHDRLQEIVEEVERSLPELKRQLGERAVGEAVVTDGTQFAVRLAVAASRLLDIYASQRVAGAQAAQTPTIEKAPEIVGVQPEYLDEGAVVGLLQDYAAQAGPFTLENLRAHLEGSGVISEEQVDAVTHKFSHYKKMIIKHLSAEGRKAEWLKKSELRQIVAGQDMQGWHALALWPPQQPED